MALGQRSQAFLAILYCSTDCLRRCGAAVQNLSHSASFHCLENNAPSSPGIKHLVRLGIEKTDVKGRRVVLTPIVERLKHGLQHFAAFGQAISGCSATAFLLDESGLTEITQPLREYLVA